MREDDFEVADEPELSAGWDAALDALDGVERGEHELEGLGATRRLIAAGRKRADGAWGSGPGGEASSMPSSWSPPSSSSSTDSGSSSSSSAETALYFSHSASTSFKFSDRLLSRLEVRHSKQ